ncbi:MAG: NYN domain-containing protein [Maribacter arcticus]|uniref:NYN domain-containing protein n=1 Tax=Maribacter arcticus TaxID=561365 RepID=UPI003002F469
MRTVFYVDGFNFYYGIKNQKLMDSKWRAAYWIDFVVLFSQFLGPNDVFEKVKYFTASPLSAGKNSRQSALLKANNIRNGNNLEIIRGKYVDRDIHCRGCGAHFTKPEEKRTDVNIATHLMGDCALNLVDKIVLVTADSDLIPPLEFIKKNFPQIKIKVYFPPTSFSADLARANPNKKVILLKDNFRKFESAAMPHKVVKADGSDMAVIPPTWV